MIPVVDLARQHAALGEELVAALARVVASARFVLGPEGEALERELARRVGVAHGVGVASGTDALRLALAALGVGPGDEVLTPAFSFVASASAISLVGATPVFVDIAPGAFAIDVERARAAVGPRTRAIVAVHLYGHPAPLDALAALARDHGLALVEDCAQALGAAWDARPVGAWGDAACLSFYPTKTLGGLGDGGMVLTPRDDVATRVRRLRHHGDAGHYRHAELGWCSRLDELQAAALRVKLRHVDAWIDRRRAVAARYGELLEGLPLALPTEHPRARHAWGLYTVRAPRRDALARTLAGLGVGTAVHYPAAVPAQPLFGLDPGAWPEAARAAETVLSLPCWAELEPAEVEAVGQAVTEALEAP